MWIKLLHKLLKGMIRTGRLRVTYPDGRSEVYGKGLGTPVHVQLHDPSMPRRLILETEMALGEGYSTGQITVEDDAIYDFLCLGVQNQYAPRLPKWVKLKKGFRGALRHISQINPAGRSKRNVAHHYDLSGQLYDLFLDTDRQYSCAYFAPGLDALEQAQAAKKAHIASKLLIEPGMRILDIGCGWGGMAITLARDFGANVVGVTLSEEQHGYATERVEKAGLGDQVNIRLQDYRSVSGPFDRIVSVGMFEHVGLPQYRTYFNKVRDLLTPDGIALVHTIARVSPPAATSPWIVKHIFPGGYIPSASEVLKSVERSGLWTTDMEVLRLHYAETLRVWYDRFMEHATEAEAIYDAQFVRMWRYYLLACEAAFRHGRQGVIQIQLARDINAVPLTRDYMYPAQRHRAMAAE